MRPGIRRADVLARYGGDEFVVIEPMTTEGNAIISAERLRSSVAGRSWSTDSGPLEVTITVGVASLDDHKCGSSEQLIKRADRALYAAKEAGRNKVSCYSMIEHSN